MSKPTLLKMEMSNEQLVTPKAICLLLPKEVHFKICWETCLKILKLAHNQKVYLAKEIQAEIVQYQRETDLSLYSDPLSWWRSKGLTITWACEHVTNAISLLFILTYLGNLGITKFA